MVQHMAGFADEIHRLKQRLVQPTVSLHELDHILLEKGAAFLVLLLSLPFIQPIPLPGVSIPIGVAIVWVGVRISTGVRRALPDVIGRRTINTKRLKKILDGTLKVFTYIEKLTHARWEYIFQHGARQLIGVTLIVNGLALSMPFPPVVLFSNSLPAWSNIALSVAVIERDGALVIVGYVIAIVTWVYFAMWAEVLWLVIQHAWDWLAMHSVF